MHFYIPAPGAATDCPSGTLDRLPERRHHVFTHLLDEFARECALASDDAITLQSFNIRINAAEQNAFSASMQCHSWSFKKLDAGKIAERVSDFGFQSTLANCELISRFS